MNDAQVPRLSHVGMNGRYNRYISTLVDPDVEAAIDCHFPLCNAADIPIVPGRNEQQVFELA